FNNGGYGYWYQSYLFYKQVTDKGKLSFETADLTYKINGVDAVAKVKSEFDLSRSDSNPPYIKDMTLTVDNNQTDIISASLSSTLKITLDPNIGTMKSATLKILKSDNTTSDIAFAGDANGVYSANLMESAATQAINSLVTLILAASDDMDNSLTYQFQIPADTESLAPNITDFKDVHAYRNQKIPVTAAVKYGSKFAWSKKTGPAELTFENADKQEATIKATVVGKYEVDFSAENGAKKTTKTLNFIIHKSGDINNDGVIDELDFASMLGNWGTPKNAMTDYNRDKVVDELDFATLLTNWNK
ncbi:MAG: hypothetical protein WC227_04500, partial [Patescibacteria group bacterium]